MESRYYLDRGVGDNGIRMVKEVEEFITKVDSNASDTELLAAWDNISDFDRKFVMWSIKINPNTLLHKRMKELSRKYRNFTLPQGMSL